MDKEYYEANILYYKERKQELLTLLNSFKEPYYEQTGICSNLRAHSDCTHTHINGYTLFETYRQAKGYEYNSFPFEALDAKSPSKWTGLAGYTRRRTIKAMIKWIESL